MICIAMWSGPRNISTAMMRAFGSRPDTAVTDEPLYAHYLKVTGVAHPGRDAILAAHESDWRKVADELTGPVPGGRAIWYQKHMAHHLLPMIDRGWLDRLTHAFLIREPDEMLASLVKTYPLAGLADTGLPQQCEIFDRVAERIGRAPPVVLSEGRISLKISTEVSEITGENAFVSQGGLSVDSNGNLISIAGVTIPGIRVRRAETTVELPSGGSMVMAGLLVLMALLLPLLLRAAVTPNTIIDRSP